MSLSEKLSKKSQELEKTEAIEAEERLAQELAPIRARIAEIENQKKELQLIKGSLELKSDENIGKGMKEYGGEVKKTKKEKTTKLDTLIEKNKKVLKTMNIEDREGLVENQEFQDEEEVMEYKKASKQEDELKMTDKALVNKLEKLGISISPEELSYDAAEQAISERLKVIQDELLQEKLKTPEGKIEVVEVLAKDLEKNIPKTTLTFDQTTGRYKFSLGPTHYEGRGIFISNTSTKFQEWNNIDLIPKDAKEMESVYGADIVNEALQKAYQSKIHDAVVSFDVNGENVFAIKEQIESVNPQEARKARKLLEEFESEQENFRIAMREKSKELKEKDSYIGHTFRKPLWKRWT